MVEQEFNLLQRQWALGKSGDGTLSLTYWVSCEVSDGCFSFSPTSQHAALCPSVSTVEGRELLLILGAHLAMEEEAD